MTICPMCGNFTDDRNCEVCGIKLNNDDPDKDQQDFDSAKRHTSGSHIFHIMNEQPRHEDKQADHYR